jgi:predicted DNA-binding WGR domain protein
MMKTTSSHHFRRIDPARNMARYYRLELQPTLFALTSVVREWGRIGRRGQRKIDLFTTQAEAMRHMDRLARAKRRRGYREATTF